MNDFVIVKADFKSFFDNVKSKYVYEKYILPSIIKSEDKTESWKRISRNHFSVKMPMF